MIFWRISKLFRVLLENFEMVFGEFWSFLDVCWRILKWFFEEFWSFLEFVLEILCMYVMVLGLVFRAMVREDFVKFYIKKLTLPIKKGQNLLKMIQNPY